MGDRRGAHTTTLLGQSYGGILSRWVPCAEHKLPDVGVRRGRQELSHSSECKLLYLLHGTLQPLGSDPEWEGSKC